MKTEVVSVPVEHIADGTAKYLIGHKGERGEVRTTMHMEGVFIRVAARQSASAMLSESDVDSYWDTIYPDDLETKIEADLNYIAKIDFMDLRDNNQAIPDQTDATSSSTGTNYLVFGDTTDANASSDPIYVPNHGTLFTEGKYAYGNNILQLTAS